MLDTMHDAWKALQNAEADTVADNPEIDLESVYADLVASVGLDCTDEVRIELCRQTGCIDRVTGYDPLAGV